MTRIVEKIVPFIKKRNDVGRLVFTAGIWINGRTYWLGNKSERFLISEGISVNMNQKMIHSRIKYFDIFVTNHGKKDVQVKLLLMNHHYTKEHFSFISPADKVIYHISNGEIHLVNGLYNGKGFNHYTIQPKWQIEGSHLWDCQEKGILKYFPMLKGAAASVHAFDLCIEARGSQKCSSWSIMGNNQKEINELNHHLLKTY
jgi:hypothetical protein